MRGVYSGTSRAGAATSAGDEFVNNASLTATTTAIPGTDPLPGTTIPNGAITSVTDDSSATQGTAAPTIDKTMKPRHEPVDCSTTGGPAYQEPGTGPDWTFRSGDTACFKLRVSFPSTISTRNPVVTDFVPVGTELLSWQVTSPPGGNTVEGVQLLVPTDPTAPVWTMGTAGTGGRFAPPGAVFEITMAVKVTAPAPTAPSGPHGQPDEAAVGEHRGHEGDDPRPGGVRDRPRARGRPAQGRLPGGHPRLRAEQPQHRRVDRPAGVEGHLSRRRRQHGDAPERPGGASTSGLGRAAGGRALLGDLELPVGRPPSRRHEHGRAGTPCPRPSRRPAPARHRDEPGRPGLRRHDQAGAHPLDRRRHSRRPPSRRGRP